MSKNNTVVVMAAGMGSRYGGLKQLDPVGPSGETILDYSVFDAQRSGFTKVVFIIRRDIEEQFRENVGKKFESRIDVRYAFQDLTGGVPEGTRYNERKKPWGTAHAILSAESEISEPFIAINADDLYGRGSFELAARFLNQVDPQVLSIGMVGFLLGKTLSPNGSVARGICSIDKNGDLTGITEVLDIEKLPDGTISSSTSIELKEDSVVSMNMWMFTPSIFVELGEQFRSFLREEGENPKAEFLIPSVVDTLIGRGVLPRVLYGKDSWFGITYPEDRPRVVSGLTKYVEEGIYPEELWPHQL